MRNNIVSALKDDLKLINGLPDSRSDLLYVYNFQTNVNDNVFAQARFLDEIYDFPTISIYVEDEERSYIGSGITQGDITLTIYAYTKGHNSQTDNNNLLEDIEHIIDEFSSQHTDLSVVDSKILQVRPDNALLAPYGGGSVTVLITYQSEC